MGGTGKAGSPSLVLGAIETSSALGERTDGVRLD
jgi:hypothetical protein